MDGATTPLRDVRAVIKALGGTAKFAQRYEIGATAVSNYRREGRFPPRLHFRIFRDCQAEGIEIDPALFEDGSVVVDD